MLIDFEGEGGKIAIILGSSRIDLSKNFTEFDQHINSLTAAGYTVIKVKNGREALNEIRKRSTKENPLDALVLLSHASPTGMSSNVEMNVMNNGENVSGWENGRGEGIYTPEGIEEVAMLKWKENNRADKWSGFIAENPLNVYRGEAFENMLDKEWESVKETETDKFWISTQVLGTDEIAGWVRIGQINFNENAHCVVGGCNSSGYINPNGQKLFSTALAKALGITVYAAEGDTSPSPLKSQTTNKRLAEDKHGVLKGGTWTKTAPDGTRTRLNKKVINLTKPEG
jgi:hypothetical protein